MASINVPRMQKDTDRVNKRVAMLFERKDAAVFALAQSYAIKAINFFRTQQAGNKYWINRSQNALDRVFTGASRADESVSFFIAHGVEYGVYLELANNRKNAALWPIAQRFAPSYFKDVRKIFKG